MPDSRQTARDKERGRPLAQAPRKREQGPGSPLGHLVTLQTPEGDVVLTTVSGQPSQGRRTGKA